MAKILVVDDDKDTCWLLSNILKEDGYQVEIAPRQANLHLKG